jgi:cytochrome P450
MADRPPGPPGVPVLGNLPAMTRKGMVEFMLEVASYGELASFSIGPTRNYLVSSPELIHDVLVLRRSEFTKDPHDLRTLGRWMGKGLLTSDGPLHRRQRRLVQPAFLRRRMDGYGEIAVESSLRLIEDWRPGDVRNMHHEMMKLTLNVVSRSMFGSGVSDAEALEVQRAVAGLQYLAIQISKFGMLVSPRLLLPLHLFLRRGARVLDRAVTRIIAERRETREDRGDLLSMFLLAQDEADGQGMTDEQVRDECVTMFVAGQETTANALTWAWHLLSENPAAAAELGSELDDVLGDRPPTAADLPRLRYTEMVFKEALRCTPPAWTLNKRTPARDLELGGYPLAAGSGVFIMPYVMHHSERHFPDSSRFDPERFAPEGPQPDRYTFMPFGGGERICVGAGFAMMEAKLILATLAQRFRFVLEPGQRVALKPLVTLAPKYGLRMRLEARERVGDGRDR